MKTLVAFDFDHTIVDNNTDTAVVHLIGKDSLPGDLIKIRSAQGWTSFMQAVFKHLHTKGVGIDVINSYVSGLPPTSGMVELIKTLSNNPDHHLIIISDSNSLFIKLWLEKHEITDCFTEVFTNPCEIVDGLLKLTPYHWQETCKLSPNNLCKGQILDEFVANQVTQGVCYGKIVYVGDGANDLCPILRLKNPTSLGCARKDYKLCEIIEKIQQGRLLDNSGQPYNIVCEILVWSTGDDIFKKMSL